MALVICPECGGNVSDKAAYCPHCGYPAPFNTSDALVLDNEVVISCIKTAKQVVIPNGIKHIQPHAFEDCEELQSVVFPNSLQSIGKHAFYGCKNLQVISNLKSSVQIDESAFWGCDKLWEKDGMVVIGDTLYKYNGFPYHVIIPEGIRHIEADAFWQCETLQSITMPESLQSIGLDAFNGCENLQAINNLKSSVQIDESAFEGCEKLADENGMVIINNALIGYYGSASHIAVPEGVTRICDTAFEDCETLQNITMPKSLQFIGHRAFCNCKNLQSINNISDSVTMRGRPFDGCEKLADENGMVIVGNILWNYYGNDGHITIPEGVQIIDANFDRVRAILTSVSLPNTLKSIASGAFKQCYGLADENRMVIVGDTLWAYYGNDDHIIIPEGVKYIDDDCFTEKIEHWSESGNCSYYELMERNLQSVTFPNSLLRIGKRAFIACENLERLENLDDKVSIGEDAFRGCERLADENGMMIIGDTLYHYYGSKSHLSVPDGIHHIQSGAFDGTESLQSIILPNGLQSLDRFTFRGCKNLHIVDLPDSLLSIDEGAFLGIDRDEFILYVSKDSYGAQFAKENNYRYSYH